jgi:hypothetical protein
MGRRSNILDIAVGGSIALFFALHTIFNILFEEWVKQQLYARFGVTVAEVVERVEAVVIPALITIAIVWLIIRLVRRDYAAQLGETRANSERQLDLLFDDKDPAFVRDRRGVYGIQSRRWYVGVHNAGSKSIDDVTMRARESQFVECTIAVARILPGDLRVRREPVIAEFRTLSPGATEMVELFGLGAEEHSEQDILSKKQTFTLEARGRDTPVALLVLEYDPLTKPPVIRRAGTASRFISLFEAATRAYEQTRDSMVSAIPEAFADSPNDILTWYCEAMARHRDGKEPFVRLWGIRPPSRIREEIYVAPLSNYGGRGQRDCFAVADRLRAV